MSQIKRSWLLADLMCLASQRPMFTTIIRADSKTGRDVAEMKAKWAGGIPQSRGNYLGPSKAFELLAFAPTIGLTITPTNVDLTHKLLGGIRKDVLVVSGSGRSDTVDLMLAGVLMWSLEHEVRLHHFGRTHTSRVNRDLAVAKDEKHFHSQAVYRPVDHERHYVPVRAKRAPNGMYFIEHQLFGEGDPQERIHLDFATGSPELMIEWIASLLKVEPIIWDRESNGPAGMLSTFDRDGMKFSIMARPIWSHPQTWE